jgi:hypothetical protein
MADDNAIEPSTNMPLRLPNPNGNLYSTVFDIDMGVSDVLFTHEKILAKIVCVPGEKVYVADIMKETYSILLEADPQAAIVTHSGLQIHKLSDFPTGKKFQVAFSPVQSDDTKRITMNFILTMAPGIGPVKSKHRRLVDHLQKHRIYLDKLHSGSDEELLAGYFMGIQADKLWAPGFSDDLRKLLRNTQFQPGELELLQEARLKLDWAEDRPPPFFVKVRNVTRTHQGAEFSTKVMALMVAKEHRKGKGAGGKVRTEGEGGRTI